MGLISVLPFNATAENKSEQASVVNAMLFFIDFFIFSLSSYVPAFRWIKTFPSLFIAFYKPTCRRVFACKFSSFISVPLDLVFSISLYCFLNKNDGEFHCLLFIKFLDNFLNFTFINNVFTRGCGKA